MRFEVPAFDSVYGVDFSGARLAGRACWVALTAPVGGGRLRLLDLLNLGRWCGRDERDAALAFLVERIRASRNALWAMDFPFGMPVQLLGRGESWRSVLNLAAAFDGNGHEFGVLWLRRAQAHGRENHVRRKADVDLKAPFSGYHYRIAYQMFHGMRDVLRPLADDPTTAILPFQYARLARDGSGTGDGGAQRVLVEACPSSTLKRWAVPHQNYKQPAGGPLTALRRRNRHAILDALSSRVDLDASHVRTIMRDGGGDALDAVLAAAGGAEAMASLDHAALARHPGVRREGWIYG